MLDLLHLPKSTPGNVDYFYHTGTSWVTWEKPRGIIMLEIICIGGGGGGRSGHVFNGSGRSGGAGGGSGGFSRLLIPAVFLPDVLYVSVGRGGAGGATTAASNTSNLGANGTASYVSIAPSTAAIYLACFANAGGGGITTGASTNAGGLAASVVTQANCLMSGLGQFFALAGQSGTAGTTLAGTAITYPTTGLLLSGGAAGGGGLTGGNFGGFVTAPTQASFSLITTRTGGLAASTADPGADGLSLFQPLMSIGGAGGGMSTSTTNNVGRGGNGGNGGFGSGGGGGGAGPSGFVPGNGAGAGGKGGDGLVIIRSW